MEPNPLPRSEAPLPVYIVRRANSFWDFDAIHSVHLSSEKAEAERKLQGILNPSSQLEHYIEEYTIND